MQSSLLVAAARRPGPSADAARWPLAVWRRRGTLLCPSRDGALECIFLPCSGTRPPSTRSGWHTASLGLLRCLDNLPNNGKLLPSKWAAETAQKPFNARPDLLHQRGPGAIWGPSCPGPGSSPRGSRGAAAGPGSAPSCCASPPPPGPGSRCPSVPAAAGGPGSSESPTRSCPPSAMLPVVGRHVAPAPGAAAAAGAARGVVGGAGPQPVRRGVKIPLITPENAVSAVWLCTPASPPFYILCQYQILEFWYFGYLS